MFGGGVKEREGDGRLLLALITEEDDGACGGTGLFRGGKWGLLMLTLSFEWVCCGFHEDVD